MSDIYWCDGVGVLMIIAGYHEMETLTKPEEYVTLF